MRPAASPASGSGNPDFANTPAATLHTAKMEPTEISIWPVRMMSIMPSAMISTGIFASNRSLKFSRVKYPGAIIASTMASAMIAIATEASRL